MKIVFMGTSEFAVPSLLALSHSHEVLAVVTQPDRPKGRSSKRQPPPVKETAVKLGLPVLQPESAKKKAFYEQLAGFAADLFVVASYGQILPERILTLPKFGCINVHASLLPRYRGASPIQAAIVNGDEISGVTIQQMAKGVDTGDILHVAETVVTPSDTALTLHDRLAELGAAALIHTLELLEAGKLNPTPQDNAMATYAGMLTKDSGRVDWRQTPRQIVNLVRGLNPWPGAFTTIDGYVLKIWKAEAIELQTENAVCGEIIAADSRGLIINANGGAVRLTEIQAPGGKRLADVDFLKGRRLTAGQNVAAGCNPTHKE